MEHLIPIGTTPAPDTTRRVTLKEVEGRAYPQGGAFRIDWASRKRVLWSPEKHRAVRVAEESVAECRNAVSRTRRELEYALARLSQFKCSTICVAVVTLQAHGPNFHRKFDLPFEYTEETLQ